MNKIQLITLDMDGTVFDPWACCESDDRSLLGTDRCRHARQDTFDRLADVMDRFPNARIVVLSWRSSYEIKATVQWLELHGIKPWKVLTPNSTDTNDLYRRLYYRPTAPKGKVQHWIYHPYTSQSGYKSAIVRALAYCRYDVVASFEDNQDVLDAIKDVSPSTEIHHVPHLVNRVELQRRGRMHHGADRYNKRYEVPVKRAGRRVHVQPPLFIEDDRDILADLDQEIADFLGEDA